MVLDKIPGPTIFTQRDVRETPAATATATSVGLTNPTYVTLSTDSDLNNERVLTAGEGMNLSDGGAGSTITVSGENASDSNKGIAKFQLSDFSVSSGDVSLKAVVVMSVDGDTGTATPALNNLDILGGTGISTAGGANDITITSTHASDNGSSHADVATNTNHRGLTNDPHSVTKSQVGLGSVTDVATSDTAYNSTSWNTNTDSATKNAIRDKVETMDTAIGLNTSKVTNVSTDLSAGTRTATTIKVDSSDGTDATLVEADTTNAGILGSDKWDEIVTNTLAKHAQSHTIVSHSDTTATGTELDTLTGGGDTTLHDHDGISENTTHRSSNGSDHSLLANKTSYVRIPGCAFLPTLETENYTFSSTTGAASSNSDATFIAPIQIPHGVVVTGAVVYGSGIGDWELRRVNSAGSATVMATAGQATEDTSITNATIDNETYAYFFVMLATAFGADTIPGARIKYTTDYD